MKNTNLDIFTKIIAAENIGIVVDSTAPTAWFDLKNRIMTLPDWTHNSDDVQIILRSHEVSHALNTPLDGWEAAVKDKSKYFGSVLNIVEDARIERLIQNEYPGLRGYYAKGYNELFSSGIFSVKTLEEVNELGLVDRFNMFFKCGHIVPVSFDADEQKLVDEGKNLETFEEALDLANRLFTMSQEKDSKTQKSGAKGVGEGGNGENGKCKTDIHSTDVSKNLSKVTEKNMVTNLRFTHRSVESLKNRIINITASVDVINSKTKQISDGKYVPLVKRAKVTGGIINTFFEQYKAARIHERTRLHKTGSLNCSRLYEYTYGDDIFLSDEIVANGKDHALLLVCDFSGSMEHNIGETFKQLAAIMDFCDRQRIPYDIYAFYATNERTAIDSLNLSNDYEIIFRDNFEMLRMFSYAYGRTKNMALREYFMKWAVNSFESSDLNWLGVSYNQGSTPLNSAIYASYEILRQLKLDTKAQVVHPIYLTDGGGDDAILAKKSGASSYKVINFIDDVNGLMFQGNAITYRSVSVAVLELMKKMGHNPTNFFISSYSGGLDSCLHFLSGDVYEHTKKEAKIQFDKAGFAVYSDASIGMKEIYLISLNSKNNQGDKVISKKFVQQICDTF